MYGNPTKLNKTIYSVAIGPLQSLVRNTVAIGPVQSPDSGRNRNPARRRRQEFRKDSGKLHNTTFCNPGHWPLAAGREDRTGHRTQGGRTLGTGHRLGGSHRLTGLPPGRGASWGPGSGHWPAGGDRGSWCPLGALAHVLGGGGPGQRGRAPQGLPSHGSPSPPGVQ